MKQSAFNQFAGVAGIVSALLFIISIIGMQAYLASPLNDISAFTQNMNEQHGMMLIYGWPGLVATMLILPLIFAFHKENKTSSNFSRMALLVTIIGLIFILVGYLFHLALTYFHAPLFQELEPGVQASFGVVIHATVGLQDMFWLSGDLFSFLGVSILLLLCLKEDVFPKWFLLLGIVAGVLAASGSISFIPAFKQIPGLSFLFIGGFSIFAIWEIIAGILLIKFFR